MEGRSFGGLKSLGGEGVCASGGKNDGLCTKGIGGTDERSHIAWILDSFQQKKLFIFFLFKGRSAADTDAAGAAFVGGKLVQNRLRADFRFHPRQNRKIFSLKHFLENAGFLGFFNHMDAFDQKQPGFVTVFFHGQFGKVFNFCICQ